jgi:hypothetical protein
MIVPISKPSDHRVTRFVVGRAPGYRSSLNEAFTRLLQQPRQLGDVGRNPPRFVLGHEIGGRASAQQLSAFSKEAINQKVVPKERSTATRVI